MNSAECSRGVRLAVLPISECSDKSISHLVSWTNLLYLQCMCAFYRRGSVTSALVFNVLNFGCRGLRSSLDQGPCVVFLGKRLVEMTA